MQNNQKRKRKRDESEAERTPAKKSKRDKPQTPRTPKKSKTPKETVKDTPKKEKKHQTPDAKKKQFKKKKFLKRNRRRKNHPPRPRLNDIRQKVARTLERALVEARGMPLIYHLFEDRDSMGTPRAPLRQVLRTLKISDYVKKTHLLKDNYMKSITHCTSMFSIEEDEPHGGLYLKYWPIYDRDDATVYVDNLPEGCCEDKLMRLAEIYGTVAELSISKKGARWIRPKNQTKKKVAGQPRHRNRNRKKKPLINVGSRPRPFGFIRFVDKDSAANMIREFAINDPSLFHERMEEKRRIEEERRRPPREEIVHNDDDIPDLLLLGDIEELDPVVPQEEFEENHVPKNRYLELYMTRLLREIRFLKMRRKRRPWPMYFRLWRLQRRYDDLAEREYRCLRRAGIINSRTILRKKQKRLIHKAFPPAASGAVHHAGRRPPPPTPRSDEPSTSDGRDGSPEDHIFINKIPRKKRHANQKKKQREPKPKKQKKPKQKEKPKRREYIEKYVNGVLVRRKRNRKRKKMSRKLSKFIPGGSVRRFFADIQVFSLKRYRELKAEYQELVRKEKERVREEAEAPPPAPEGEAQEPQEPLDPDMEVPEIEPEIEPELEPALDPEMEMDF
ncbi:unnamed protein product [Caenorhabditis brenneri]